MSTVVCSHGFGVRADGRGMFTELQTAFPEHAFVMFDYNQVLKNGDIVVAPIDQQVVRLEKVLSSHSDAVLLAHSQGCIVASMANMSHVKKVVLLAPPVEMSMQRVIDKLSRKPGATIDLEGVSKLPRRDGTTTQITHEYIQSVNNVNPSSLYANLAQKLPVTIIRATNDDVLGLTNFNEVPEACRIDLDADHDFQDVARTLLINALRPLL